MNDRAAEWEEKKRLGRALVGRQVRFNSEGELAPLKRVVSVGGDGLVAIEGYVGLFAPHLFRVVEETPQPAPPCAQCGGPHPFDFSVPSDLWNLVIREAGLPDFLCATCILRAFARSRVNLTATLWGDGFEGLPITIRFKNV